MKPYPSTVFGWKLRALMGSLKSDSPLTRFGKLASLTAVCAFSIGATLFFRAVFANLVEIEGLGEPLLWRILSIALATIFVMLVISNVITGIGALYRDRELAFLMAKPLTHRQVFHVGFVDNLVFSSWSLAVLGVPLVTAWGWVFGLPGWTVILAVAGGLAPLVLLASVVAAVILMGLVTLARLTSPRKALLVVLVAITATVGGVAVQRSGGLVVEGRSRLSTVERYLAGLRREPPRPLTPPQWMTAMMRALRRQDYGRAAFFGVLLVLTAVVWMRWLSLLAGRWFYRTWTDFADLSGRTPAASTRSAARRFTRGWLPNPLNAMLRKDLLQFVRTPAQWAQFILLVTFLLLYLVNLLWVSSRFDFSNPNYRVLVMFLNFAFTGFILATLSVRFVYPLISLEGRAFWLVRSSPVNLNLLFWEKFFLAFAVFMWLCELIVLASNRVLHVSGAMMLLTTAATFLMGATLTALAVGMGALMPDFRDENPMRIASTPGGVLTVILSLLYVAAMVAALAWPTQGYFRYLLGRGAFPAERARSALVLVTGLNLLAFLVPLRLGWRALKARDV